MKRIFLATLIVLSVSSCMDKKIGFVDNSVLINDYQEKKDIEAKLQLKVNAFRMRADSLRKEFQLKINEAEVKAKGMSQSAIQKLSNELRQEEQSLSQRLQFQQQQIAQESQVKNDSLVEKVKTFIKNYGQENGYDFILGSNEAGSVMYGKSENDLTETLLKALNDAYKKSKS